MAKQPLAEVFGYKIDDDSDEAKRHRMGRLCPFNNKESRCTKVSKKNPLGVCSLFESGELPPTIICPVRFTEGDRDAWDICKEAASFFFPPNTRWSQLGEVRLKNKSGGPAGNIDMLLVALDNKEQVINFGAMEIQSVYISGNVRDPFESFMKAPSKGSTFDWEGHEKYPTPDYLSSTRKRLMPQLLSKGEILQAWEKKQAIVVHENLYDGVPDFTEVEKGEAEVIWLIYTLEYSPEEKRYKLVLKRRAYTRFKEMLEEFAKSEAGEASDFIKELQKKLDKKRKQEQREKKCQPKTVSTKSASKKLQKNGRGELQKEVDVYLLSFYIANMVEIQSQFEEFDLGEVVNVAKVSKYSPFRYPGGKTWLVPRIRQWLKNQPNEFIEPFAGGGIVGLTVAFEKLAKHVIMVELDDQVAAVWKTIFEVGGGEWLAEKIVGFNLTLASLQEELLKEPRSTREKAFQTILKNRTFHGGILAAGSSPLKHGENGKGIKSRWYAETLKKRILAIASIRKRISFIEGDGIKVISRYAIRDDVVFFIDPPYTVAGKRAGTRLYTFSNIDHEGLFRSIAGVAGDFLMTYDDADGVRELALKHGFDTELVAMKNTHHAEMTELLIGRNLDWVRRNHRDK